MPGLLDGVNLNDPRAVAALPEWLRRQIVPVSNDENGPQMGFNGLYDQQNRQVFRVGDNHSATDNSTGDLSLIDPSAFRDDPTLGRISDIGNVRNVQSASFRNGLLATQLAIAAMTGMGAYQAMGGGGLMGGEAMSRAIDPSLLGNISGATGTGAGGAALSAAPEIVGGSGILGGSAVPMGQIAVTAPSLAGGGFNAGLLAPLAAGAASTFNPTLDNAPDIQRAPEERPWYQDTLDGITNNPLQALGRGMSLYNIGRGLFGNNRSGGGDGPPDGDGKGGGGEAVNTQPLQRGPWTPNPITQQQIQNFQYARPRG